MTTRGGLGSLPDRSGAQRWRQRSDGKLGAIHFAEGDPTKLWIFTNEYMRLAKQRGCKFVVVDPLTDEILHKDYQRHDTKQPEKP